MPILDPEQPDPLRKQVAADTEETAPEPEAVYDPEEDAYDHTEYAVADTEEAAPQPEETVNDQED